MQLFLKFFLAALVLSFNGFGQSFFPTVSGSCWADNPIEVGTKFTTSANATITGLRFFKCNNGTQVYTLKLYSGSTLAIAASYTGTATGWITVPITPIQIIPGVNYTVSYYSPGGWYQFFNPYSWPVKTGILTATSGVYAYKAVNNNTLPVTSYQSANYFADVVVSVAPPIKDTVYIRDTIYMQGDTTHVLYGWDGLDTVNYNLPKYYNFKVVELPTFDGKRIRYRHYITEAIKREEWDEVTKTWIEK